MTIAEELKAQGLKQGLEPVGNPPDEFDAYIRTEIDKWSKVVKQAGLKPDLLDWLLVGLGPSGRAVCL